MVYRTVSLNRRPFRLSSLNSAYPRKVMAMKWNLKTFDELNTHEMFEYLKLRQSVFVVEQTCPYPDIDDTDRKAHHLLAWQGTELAACARLIPAGVTYEHPSIGRIATSKQHRGTGLGRELVSQSIDHLHRLYPGTQTKIGAQERLEKFYQSFGFATVSTMYLEDDIPHIDMLLAP